MHRFYSLIAAFVLVFAFAAAPLHGAESLRGADPFCGAEALHGAESLRGAETLRGEAVQQRDTTALMHTMAEYLKAIDYLPYDEASAEVDFLISSVQDTVLRSAVAVRAYKHFLNSKVMGSENVAVHIYDNWFANFKAVYDTIEELDEAEFHAFINRASLLGKKATPLTFKDLHGHDVILPSSASSSSASRSVSSSSVPRSASSSGSLSSAPSTLGSGPSRRKARPSVIFFYSVGCPNCLLTSYELCEFFKKARPEVDLYTIYTGEDVKQWRRYVRRELNIRSSRKSKAYHLIGGDVDYAVPYAVTQTPRLFLVDGDGVIVGRCLDVNALKILLAADLQR